MPALTITHLYFNLAQKNKGQSLALFPNPAERFLQIKGVDASGRLQVFDAYGKLMKEQHENCLLLDINDLPAGIYCLKLYFANSIKTTKLIKQW